MTSGSVLELLIDANVDHDVGRVATELGQIVHYANELFLPKTPDSDIDFVARTDGLIIVGHDKRFLRKIQQPRFNFSDPASSGYGRIMLCGEESGQPERIRDTMSLMLRFHQWAAENGRRFLVIVGDNWIRFDDRPLERTPKAAKSAGSGADG